MAREDKRKRDVTATEAENVQRVLQEKEAEVEALRKERPREVNGRDRKAKVGICVRFQTTIYS